MTENENPSAHLPEQSKQPQPETFTIDEALKEEAAAVEHNSYIGDIGRQRDGSPYSVTYPLADEFLKKVLNPPERIENIKAAVEGRKDSGEERADPENYNWILWTILNKYGVTRERI